MLKNLLFAFSILALFVANKMSAQQNYDFGFTRNDSIQVFDSSGVLLKMPWVGGLNSVHFQEIDLDIDGKMDLIIFDVHGDKLYPFINQGDSGEINYKYSPWYVHRFPTGLTGWVQCVDYDFDGKKDLFTYVPGGIALYRNVSTPASGLVFQLISPMLNYSSATPFPVNIFVTAVDFPVIADLDSDGDVDILAFHILGTFVVHYKNMSMELYGNPLNIEFKEVEKCWGKFAESEEINSIYLNVPCGLKGSASSKSTKHTGSTMLGINLNGDSLMDMILGDVDFFTLNALINGGNKDTAVIISQDTLFPSYDVPVNMVSFPLASYMDIDNDGVKEMMVSPFESAYYKPEALNSIWFYDNLGSNDFPIFELIKKDFFQDQMIEVGDNATPEIVDVDGDGLMDIVVTSYGIVDSTYFDPNWFILWTHKSSSMTWFKNVGTTTAPAFKYMDGDLFNIRSLKLTATKSTFGDLDADGDMDMILGSSSGTLIYYENIAGAGNMMSFAPPVMNYASIHVGEYSTPELFDIDGDSLLDLVIGQKSGFLSYFKNTGSDSIPQFTKVTDTMGGVRVNSYWHYYSGYSVPEVYRDNLDSVVMMVGSASGKIFYFKDVVGNVKGHFGLDSNLVYKDYVDTLYSVAYFMNEGNILEYLGVGMRSAPAIFDFNGDSFLDLVVGNFSGGLNFFKGDTPRGVGIKQVESPNIGFKIFPNPASDYFIVDFDDSQLVKSAHISVFNTNGQIVAERILNNGNATRLNFDYLPTGVYFVGIKITQINQKVNFGSAKVLIVNQ